MMQGNGRGAGGFTLVETIIVLAVSSAILISAIVVISGKHDRTLFQTSINQVQQQVQQVIDEVASGEYPSNDNIICTTDALGNVSLSSGSAPQGTNGKCMFLGKMIQFAPSGAPENFIAYSIVASSKATGLVTSKQPVAIYPNSGHGGWPNNSNTTILPGGLKVVSMYYNGSPGNTLGTVGFLSSLGQLDANGNLLSGSQRLVLVGVPSALGQSQDAAVSAIDTQVASYRTSEAGTISSIQICFQSGSTDQSGLMTIGAVGNPTAITMQIKGNTTCA